MAAFAVRSSYVPRATKPIHRLEDAVQRHVRFVLELCDGNLTHAAVELGIARRSLQRMLARWRRKRRR